MRNGTSIVHASSCVQVQVTLKVEITAMKRFFGTECTNLSNFFMTNFIENLCVVNLQSVLCTLEGFLWNKTLEANLKER
jgi:hypothetical protein